MAGVGEVAALFRYPVKSMLGEALETARLGPDGIPGDRAWGLRDEARGDFFVGKRVAGVMGCRATYPGGFSPGDVPEIRLPDGEAFQADAPNAGDRLSAYLEREVRLLPASAADGSNSPSDPIPEAEMRAMLAREADEPLPDFSTPSPEQIAVANRAGPLFDAFPLLLLSDRSMQTIAASDPDLVVDARRFRPNVLIDSSDAYAYPEQHWIGRRLRIGEAVVRVHSRCVRCAMVTHGFADLPRSPEIMRSLVRHNDGNLGVYGIVERGGVVRRGDVLQLLE